MPLGKYYCDYCDKHIQDTPPARKRHLQGIQHLRAKALWYDSLKFQDPRQVYSDGFVKGVCTRFVKTGYCQYGDSCKYVHPRILTNANPQGGVLDNMQPAALTTATNLVGGGCPPGNAVQGSMGMAWDNLPPSLKPPPEGGYPVLPFLDWG
ncbi:zinc finger CCCH domain-containing protein 3 [Prosopis cineraria]|uniref:zinc finger CCCH domain-containing protein 3 n=1 Tax=Prosopis cineraria TaxID=364024 RepID=UPI00240ECE7A|nr:zinc finger CCCH domain-containing protein 3 [Prosopis cineraria]